MADRIVLNTPRFKGEYPLDVEEQPFTNLEWRWVKKISGYMPATISEGWDGADPDLFVAFAVIALARAGKIDKAAAMGVAESFDDLPTGSSITVASDDADADGDVDPPELTAEMPPPLRSIGGASPPTSESPESPLEATGVRA